VSAASPAREETRHALDRFGNREKEKLAMLKHEDPENRRRPKPARLRAAKGRIDVNAIYRARRDNDQPSAPRRPKTLNDLVRDYYGPRSDVGELIHTNERGGSR
jgi:hypothetical protein